MNDIIKFFIIVSWIFSGLLTGFMIFSGDLIFIVVVIGLIGMPLLALDWDN